MSRLRLVLMLVVTTAAIVSLPDVSAAQPVASGGGCQDAGSTGMDSCVAASGTSMPLQLIGNFGINNFSNTSFGGQADYFMCFAGGGCNFHFTVVTNQTGSYPLMFDQTGLGAGSARSEFDMYDVFVSYYGTRVSPWQDWVP